MATSLTTRLVTPRLVLRPPRTGDVAEVRRVMRANAEHLKPWNPAPPAGEDPTSITEVSKTVLRHRRDWKRGSGYVFMVAERERQGTFIGKIALSGIMRGAMCGAYLGYWMAADSQGRGLVTEGIGAVLDFAFGPAGLHRVQAAIMPRNARSLRVIEKLGFRREGYAERYLQIAGKWEDHILFARTREEHFP
jgi:ribosomal-protein-alanine N-acetyltransferase